MLDCPLDEIESLRKLVRDQAAQITHLKQLVESNKLYIRALEDSLRLANQRHFGPRTEKHSNQIELNLFGGQFNPSSDSDDHERSTIKVAAHSRRPKRKHTLPEDLPRVIVEHDLPEAEKNCGCGAAMNRIGSETSEQLSVILQQWYVLHHVRHKYACPNGCIETAPMPPQPIPASQASPQLLAHTIVSKFHDGLPLYRLC